MLLSEFTPIELFELSDEEPIAERIYYTMVAAHGGQFDMTPGESYVEGKCFATALSKARMIKLLERAGYQAYAATVDDKLVQRESEFRITPPFDATLPERQAVITKLRRRPKTWSKARITAELQDLLGDALIAYIPTPLADAVRWPASLGAQPQNLQRPSSPRKLIRITQPISAGLGATQPVTYEVVDTPAAPTSGEQSDLVVGDTLAVEPEVLGITETVTVELVGPGFFYATFDNPHTEGCLATTACFPQWISTKRHNLVVVTPAAAVDPETRRAIDDAMRRMVRASSTWDIVQSADGLHTEDFIIGESPIGAKTLVDITI